MTPLPLRHIAIYVEEPRPKKFAWVLNESADGGVHWEMLQRAGKPVGSYQEAMAAGLAALQEMVDDTSLGPRGEPEVEAPAKVSKGGSRKASKEVADEDSDDAVEEEPAAPAAKKAYFGFGPVR
jgi:hypothetical protein